MEYAGHSKHCEADTSEDVTADALSDGKHEDAQRGRSERKHRRGEPVG